MRSLLLARRSFKEILRDPLSLVFSLGFPVLLLVAFRVINYYANGNWMTLSELVPGVAVFSLSFIMLYMTLLVSKDRATSFLSRLYTAPLRATDFIIGYALPGVVLGMLQSLITYLAGMVVSLVPNGALAAKGVETVSKTVDHTTMPPVTVEGAVLLPFGGIFAATLAALPTILLFVSLGILFGTLLNEKSAPGISSAVITASGLLGGAWMPLSSMGGFADFCRFLPFYPATTLARTAFMLNTPTANGFWLPLFTVTLWCAVVFAAAVLLFLRSMRGEK